MLIDSKLPNKYWDEAIITAKYLQNILPTAGKITTPHKRWEGVQPNVTHIRQFGCKAYSVIPAEKDGSSIEDNETNFCRLYAEASTKGYRPRLLDTATEKISISRDVAFIESNPHLCRLQQHQLIKTMNSTVQTPTMRLN